MSEGPLLFPAPSERTRDGVERWLKSTGGLLMVLFVVQLAVSPLASLARDAGADTEDVGTRTAIWFVDGSSDGINICSGPDHDCWMAIPYGNVTMWEATEIPQDLAKTPEMYAGIFPDPDNGFASDAGYYVFTDFGSKMCDWWPSKTYYLMAEVNVRYGWWEGYHPSATKNYTASSKTVWASDGTSFPDDQLRPYPVLTATSLADRVTLSWTDLPDTNGVITGYAIYRMLDPTYTWTRLAVVGEGIQTYTDSTVGGDYGYKYCLGIRYAENLFTKGRSNIQHRVFTPQPPLSQDIPFFAGWNLISLAVDTDGGESPAVLLANEWDNIESLLSYDTQNSTWLSYDSSLPGWLNTLKLIDERMGLWVKFDMAGDGTLTVSGTQPISTTILLARGWNLVGFPASENRPASVVLAGTGFTALQQFQGGAQYLIDDMQSDDNMIPGHAYWVHVPAATSYTVSYL